MVVVAQRFVSESSNLTALSWGDANAKLITKPR